jgi:hypothetical protein
MQNDLIYILKIVINIAISCAAALISDRCKLDLQRGLLPQRVHLLVAPVLALRLERHVKVKQNLGYNDSHLVVCQADLC